MGTRWDLPTICLLALAALVAALILAGVRRADRLAGGRPYFPWAAAGLALWLAYAAQLSLRGKLLPPPGGGAPPIYLLMPPGVALAVLAVFSPLGTRLTALSLTALIGFHAFRLPLEFLLYAFHFQGRLPIQMTFAGRNFDVLSGLSSIYVAYWISRGKAGRRAAWAWNLGGLALLINIVAVALLSLPAPWRAFPARPPNELVLHFPYVFIPALFVMSALAGHLLLFRKLARGRRGEEMP